MSRSTINTKYIQVNFTIKIVFHVQILSHPLTALMVEFLKQLELRTFLKRCLLHKINK